MSGVALNLTDRKGESVLDEALKLEIPKLPDRGAGAPRST